MQKQTFYSKLLIIIFISACNEYFHMTTFICARNVATAGNIESRP